MKTFFDIVGRSMGFLDRMQFDTLKDNVIAWLKQYSTRPQIEYSTPDDALQWIFDEIGERKEEGSLQSKIIEEIQSLKANWAERDAQFIQEIKRLTLEVRDRESEIRNVKSNYYKEETELRQKLNEKCEALTFPVEMILTCPSCKERHIDSDEYVDPRGRGSNGQCGTGEYHHTHTCKGCGMIWQPSKRNTKGVKFLRF